MADAGQTQQQGHAAAPQAVAASAGSVAAVAPRGDVPAAATGESGGLVRNLNDESAALKGYERTEAIGKHTDVSMQPNAAAVLFPSESGGGLAGSKRPIATLESLPPINREGRNLSEKKLRRLEKNRLSARECRRKKREAAQNLEREINVLEAENLRLRLQLQIGEEAEQTSSKEQEKVTEGLNSLLKSGASESEIYGQIEEFKEKFADYGRDRRTAIEFHLRNVSRLLMPTTTTSIAMRALHGGGPITAASHASSSSVCKDSSGSQCSDAKLCSEVSASSSATRTSSNSAAVSCPTSTSTTEPAESSLPPQQRPPLEPKALFQYLVKYLEVTREQAAALKDSRSVAKELDSSLQQALSVHDELRQRLTQVVEDLEAEMNSVRAVLTPTQAAKFLVWVANNGACMHMLNELWSKVYPQPDQDDD